MISYIADHLLGCVKHVLLLVKNLSDPNWENYCSYSMVHLANIVCLHYMTALSHSTPNDKYAFKHLILKYVFTSFYFFDMPYANVLT